ncbi:MAG TPA: hypothetical protein VGD50_05900, partial [Candidatus Baltobacteraceae bacterium]
MPKMHFDRGNAMPETALTMSLVLLVFFGLIKIALIGYEQAEVDGASFVAAHASAITTDPQPATYGQTRANADFGVATTAVQVTAAPVLAANVFANGGVTAQVQLGTGGLFLSQGFVGLASTLHSTIIEPDARGAQVVPILPPT